MLQGPVLALDDQGRIAGGGSMLSSAKNAGTQQASQAQAQGIDGTVPPYLEVWA